MKKIFALFLALAILTSCICVSANSDFYTCQPKIGLDPTKNAVDFEFTLSDNVPNDYFIVAMYIERRLDNITVVPVSEIQAIIEENKVAESDAAKKYISLELEKTPDEIKVFAWNDKLIPVCEEKILLASSADFEAANKAVTDELTAARDLLYNLRWVKRKFIYDSELELYTLLYSLSGDALTKSGTCLFTRDNAQEIYNTELQTIKSIYTSMSKDEKDHFYNCFYELGRVDFAHFEYLINYLGIKEYVI